MRRSSLFSLLSLLILAFTMFLFACTQKETIISQKVKANTAVGICKTFDYTKIEQIGVMQKGDVADLLDMHGDYIKVSTNGIVLGWTYVEYYQQLTNRTYICKNEVGAAILDKPTKPYRVIGGIKKGVIVQQIDVLPTWYKVSAVTADGDRTGWIYAPHSDRFAITNVIEKK